MRKLFAALLTVVLFFAVKETVYLYIGVDKSDAEIMKNREHLIAAAWSITIPLFILTLWLWATATKPKQDK